MPSPSSRSSSLASFAYQAPLGGSPFVLAGGLTLVGALLTVGYRAVRTALTNPADALRYE